MMTRLNQILFARNSDATEKATLLGFLASHEKVVREKTADGKLAIDHSGWLERYGHAESDKGSCFLLTSFTWS